MIYYIVPPIFVILGTAGLIMFLLRKTSGLPQAELILEKSKERKMGRLFSLTWKKLIELALKILERIIRIFKLYSLKFHNNSQKWFQSIRKRREERVQQKIQEKTESEKIVEPKAPVMHEMDASKIRPTISSTVVLPESKKEIKDRFEDSLIERIASNPGDVEAYERLGDYYIERTNYAEAVECYKHIVKLSPVHRKAKIRLKRLERMLGR